MKFSSFFRKKQIKFIENNYDQYISYKDENSPWRIKVHRFTNSSYGFQVMVLRNDPNCQGWCNIFNSSHFWYSHSKVIFNIEENELKEIIQKDFDTYENWIGLLFSTKEEAERFIDEYSHHYDTTYLANILSGIL